MRVGDNCVYPAHGLCTVKRIDEREVGGKRKKFYILQVVDSLMTIMCPVDAAGTVGIRDLITKQQAIDVLAAIERKQDAHVENLAWNRSFRDYMGRIKTGNPFDIASVVRDVAATRAKRDITFGERRMMDDAIRLLSRELAIAMEVDDKTAHQMIATSMEANNEPR